MQKLSYRSMWSVLFAGCLVVGGAVAGAQNARDNQAGDAAKSSDSAADNKESTGANAGAPSATKGQKGAPSANDQNDLEKDAAAGGASTGANNKNMKDKKSGSADASGDKSAQGGDAQVLGHITVLNENEIAMSSLAENKQLSGHAKEVNEMIHKDHTANLDKTKQLATDLKISVVEDVHAKQMREQGKQKLDQLKALDGEEFEQAYLQAMIEGHQHGLDMIDNMCLPMAKDAKVKQHLKMTREAVAKHLEHCQSAAGQDGGNASNDAGSNGKSNGNTGKSNANNNAQGNGGQGGKSQSENAKTNQNTSQTQGSGAQIGSKAPGGDAAGSQDADTAGDKQ